MTQSLRKIYVILVEYCMKLTLLSASKGSNYYKHVEKTYNFRKKSSQKLANSIFRKSLKIKNFSGKNEEKKLLVEKNCFDVQFSYSIKVVKVHQNSVQTYLEDILMGSVDQTADLQARSEIMEMADKINDVAYDIEDK